MPPVAEPIAAAPVANTPAARPEIKVSEMTPAGKTPAAPPKPGSAKERMAQELHKRFDAPEPAAETKPGADKPAATEVPEAAAEGSEAAAVKAAAEGKEKKVSPWKLLDEERKARAQEAAARQEIEKRAIPNEKWEEYQTKQKAIETRNKELEDHIRYVDYSQSKEFQDKYQKPYEAAWNRALGDLKELSVEDGQTGQARAFGAKDMLELVNLPLPEARKVAVDKYGDFADDVMQQRKEIRRLYDEQATALSEAKTSGAERLKKQYEEQQRTQQETSKAILNEWTEENQAVLKDEKYGKYFTPAENDDEGNKRLEKGFAIADKAFALNPSAPGLTPEQRREVVKLHAAVRNRCAAFGRVVYQNQQNEAKIAALQKEIADLKGAEPEIVSPGRGGGAGASGGGEGGSAMSRMQKELAKYAKPA